jgi:hypothetical protein
MANYFTISHYSGAGEPQPSLQFVSSRGTSQSPLAVRHGDILGVLGPMGYDGSGAFPSDVDYSAEIAWYATQDFSPGKRGTQTRFYAVANDTRNNYQVMVIDQNGNVGINTLDPKSKLDVNDNAIIIEQSNTPINSSSACVKGAVSWDSGFVYVCVANNTWKRAALSAW